MDLASYPMAAKFTGLLRKEKGSGRRSRIDCLWGYYNFFFLSALGEADEPDYAGVVFFNKTCSFCVLTNIWFSIILLDYNSPIPWIEALVLPEHSDFYQLIANIY